MRVKFGLLPHNKCSKFVWRLAIEKLMAIVKELLWFWFHSFCIIENLIVVFVLKEKIIVELARSELFFKVVFIAHSKLTIVRDIYQSLVLKVI